ncbi:MAG: hypothetical protein KGL53_10425, partial [Elusimicrobia bacterium]|nr:hypothetical protein [Elusimicrobiota bacterium]
MKNTMRLTLALVLLAPGMALAQEAGGSQPAAAPAAAPTAAEARADLKKEGQAVHADWKQLKDLHAKYLS